MSDSLRILLVAEDPEQIRRVGEGLKRDPAGGISLEGADSLATARRRLSAAAFDLALLDLDLGGLHLLAEFRAMAGDVPVVVLATGKEAEASLAMGAQDCVAPEAVDCAGFVDRLRASSLRARADAATAARGLRIASALEAAGDVVWQWERGTDGIWLAAAEPAAWALPGPDCRESSEALRERIHPDDRERVLRRLEEALASQGAWQIEGRLRVRDGAWRWCELRGRAGQDGRGRTVRAAGLLCDVHRQQKMVRELNLARRQLRALFDSEPIPQAIINASGLVTDCNQAWLDLPTDGCHAGADFRPGAAYLPGAADTTRVGGLVLAELGRGIRQVLGGVSERFDCTYGEAPRCWHIRVTPLLNPGIAGAVVQHEDVTAAADDEARNLDRLAAAEADLEALPGPCLRLDAFFRVVDCNTAARQLAGGDPEGRDILKALPRADADAVGAALAELGGKQTTALRDATDGAGRAMRWIVRGRRHAGGSPQGFLLAGVDVSDLLADASGRERGLRDASEATERLRSERDDAHARLAAAEARERETADALADARQEAERLQLQAREARESLDAAAREREALQRGHGDTAAALAAARQEHESLAQRERAAATALENARRDLETLRQREREAAAALEAAQLDLQSLTAERRQRATLARLLDALPGLAAWVRPDGRLGWANRAWQAMFGGAGSLADALGPDRLAELEPRMRAALAGEAVSFSVVLAVDGQPRQLEASWIPQQEEGRPAGFVAAFHDLTARREAEARLFQARKMEAIGQLTGGVAHELGNVLGVVTGNLQVLEHELAAEPAARRRLKAALDAAGRGAEVTGRLLAFSRQQDLEPEILSVNDFLSRHAPLFERGLGKSASLELVLDDAAWPVRVDPAQLETALLHLVANAADAIEGAGRVAISTANQTLDTDAARRLLGPSAMPGDYLELSVSDTGSGIPEELLARVFDPFFTTKSAARAAGLGLSMVWGFAQQSGGRATLESGPGEGTRATLWLPRHRGADRHAEPAMLAEATPPLPARNALVVEPDPALRDTAVAMLGLLGWRATGMPDAQAALSYLAEWPVDLLFTELAPGGGLDGTALARRARLHWPELKVLFATAYGVLDGAARHPVIEKPYRREALEQVLGELTAGEPTRG